MAFVQLFAIFVVDVGAGRGGIKINLHLAQQIQTTFGFGNLGGLRGRRLRNRRIILGQGTFCQGAGGEQNKCC